MAEGAGRWESVDEPRGGSRLDGPLIVPPAVVYGPVVEPQAVTQAMAVEVMNLRRRVEVLEQKLGSIGALLTGY